MVKLTDRPAMTIAVDMGRKETTNKQTAHPRGSRVQYEYQETLSLPIDVSKSIQSPYRCH